MEPFSARSTIMVEWYIVLQQVGCLGRFCKMSNKHQKLPSEDLVEQMKEMAAAEKRWQSQVRDGKVKSISPKQAGYRVQLSNHTLIDVRPSTERKKAWVKNSIWVPLFDTDRGFDPGTLLKKFSNFILGGWWSGLPLMRYNDEFIPTIMKEIPKDANLIVVCQKGIRSLAACEQLYKAGYRNLYWVEGGFAATEEGDLEREGSQPFKLAGGGGVSEFLGWTDEQRVAGSKEGWGYRAVFFGRLVGVVLLADAIFLGAQQLEHVIHYLRNQ
eukprot:c26372_g1_i3 orf=258-1067(+)